MASEIVIEFSDPDGKIYRGKARDGHVSITNLPGDTKHCMFESNIQLQSWPSFKITSPVSIFVMLKIGARVIGTRKFQTNELRIDRGEQGHAITCLVDNIDLREYFGSIHEHSA